jgi:DNA-binding PadR family transcriptional regulator
MKDGTWKSWPNSRAYWLDPDNKPPHWRIRRIYERSEKGRKLLAEIDKVKRTKGFAQL